jgi:uroporphyrinogen III methyltransferase/synthase
MSEWSELIRAGTRSSNLALVQTRDALERLAAAVPGLRFEAVGLQSPGDRDQVMDLKDSPADFFTRDLDEGVLRGDFDCAVHSAKDMPDPVREGLDWFWLPWREDARDALIRPAGLTVDSLRPDGRIGVSSVRREDYCRQRFPRVRLVPIRGTIEQRLEQLDRGDYDMILMAGAALNRLGREDRITEWIPLDALPPPEGQGSLALTFRAGDARFQCLRRLFVKAVTFSAAGVGSAGACTLEGLAALQRCDVCLHDTLLGHDLLEMLPPTVQCINVGKRCGEHSVPQDETTYMITRYARRGLRVVRLKGGDPGIFGRLAEEVDALDALRMPYRVLPGLSSLNAATSGTGMLLTRRGVSRGFCVMTPRKEGGAVGSIAAAERARLPIVFFMALGVAGEVARQLIEEDGLPPQTPAAAVLGAGSDQARVLSATLGTIADRIAADASGMAGLLIVGEAAARRYGAWGALEGRRVLLTASRSLQDKAAGAVADYGGVPVCRPLIRLVPSAEGLEKIRTVGAYAWVVLTSPSAVRAFGELLQAAGVDLRQVPKLISCGEGTTQALKRLGLHPELEPPFDFGAESLLAMVRPHLVPGATVLRLRSDKAGPGLADALRAMGARVEDCVLYTNERVQHEFTPEFDAVFFASASAVEAFEAQWGGMLKAALVVAIGKPTLAALKRRGLEANLVAPEATVEASIEALAAHYVHGALSALKRAEKEPS